MYKSDRTYGLHYEYAFVINEYLLLVELCSTHKLISENKQYSVEREVRGRKSQGNTNISREM